MSEAVAAMVTEIIALTSILSIPSLNDKVVMAVSGTAAVMITVLVLKI
jgi:hypothetical protein